MPKSLVTTSGQIDFSDDTPRSEFTSKESPTNQSGIGALIGCIFVGSLLAIMSKAWLEVMPVAVISGFVAFLALPPWTVRIDYQNRKYTLIIGYSWKQKEKIGSLDEIAGIGFYDAPANKIVSILFAAKRSQITLFQIPKEDTGKSLAKKIASDMGLPVILNPMWEKDHWQGFHL